MYVVAGVTGHTGKVVAETLLAQGHAVRVIVRDEAKGAPWRPRGAEVAVASLDDAAALTAALRGAAGAYLLVPPQYGSNDMLRDQAVVADAIVAAVKASGVPHVVMLSSLGAGHAHGTGPIRTLHRFERALEAAAPNVTYLRAAYFVENLGQVLGEVTTKGVYPTFLSPNRPIAMVASADIGRTAAALLLDPARGMRIVDLFGPAELSQEEVARVFSEQLGREVTPAFAPLEYAEPAFIAGGMPANVAALFREMLGAINGGLVAPSGPPAEVRRGTTPAKDVIAALLAGGVAAH